MSSIEPPPASTDPTTVNALVPLFAPCLGNPNDHQPVSAGPTRWATDSDDYFEAATGGPSGSAEIQSLYYGLPEGAYPDSKRLLTIVQDHRPIGVVDAILHFPTWRECAIGLFLIQTSHRRRRIGTAVAQYLTEKARQEGIDTVFVNTPIGWTPGAAFLRHVGFNVEPQPRDDPPTDNRNIDERESAMLRAELRISAQASRPPRRGGVVGSNRAGRNSAGRTTRTLAVQSAVTRTLS